METFRFHADLDDPAKLLPALRVVTGETDVRLAQWDGLDDVAPTEHAKMNVRWLKRPGRFQLDVEVWGENICPRDTEARFARAMAKELGHALLFGDCSAFPFSYFMAKPDGTIWLVLIRIGEEDIMDLENDDPNNPNMFIPRLIVCADEPLPERSPGAPTSWQHGDTTCEAPVEGRPCRVFAMACPKRRPVESAPPRP
jgi:hypothetical protein